MPKYLQQRHQEQQRAQQDFEDFVKDSREQGAMTNLSEERRQAVLEVPRCWNPEVLLDLSLTLVD